MIKVIESEIRCKILTIQESESNIKQKLNLTVKLKWDKTNFNLTCVKSKRCMIEAEIGCKKKPWSGFCIFATCSSEAGRGQPAKRKLSQIKVSATQKAKQKTIETIDSWCESPSTRVPVNWKCLKRLTMSPCPPCLRGTPALLVPAPLVPCWLYTLQLGWDKLAGTADIHFS